MGSEVNGNSVLQAGREYAALHGAKCAAEIILWRRKGVYQGEALEALADILKPLESPSASALRVAEDLVVEAALKALAGSVEKSQS